jgi:multisubunit Na+/H+ antiporter MnhF subunit
MNKFIFNIIITLILIMGIIGIYTKNSLYMDIASVFFGFSGVYFVVNSFKKNN